MRILLITYLLLVPVFQGIAQSDLTVEIKGLQSNKGQVIVALLDSNEEDVTDLKTSISGKKCKVTFRNLKHGQYAVRFIHDENKNDEFDTNFIGIPKEGFGFSNNAFGRFGPKDFSEWLFEVNGYTTITLTIKYLF
jgi:uncharacterized protein (DUF2141 family)